MSTLFAFLHHVAAFTLVSALAVEFVLIRQDLTLAIARRLPIVDAVLGISAGFLLVVGLLRVFFFEKGAAYYFHSHAFMTKFSVFIAVGLLSIIPTLEFLSWRKPVKAGEIPAVSARKLRFIRSVIHGELAAVVIILLCAAMMGRVDMTFTASGWHIRRVGSLLPPDHWLPIWHRGLRRVWRQKCRYRSFRP